MEEVFVFAPVVIMLMLTMSMLIVEYLVEEKKGAQRKNQ